MIKALVQQSDIGPEVDMEFTGRTVDLLYEHSMMTLALLTRLTHRMPEGDERNEVMLHMFDGITTAVVGLIGMGAANKDSMKIVEAKSVEINDEAVRRMLNKEGENDANNK